ncbi:unnamed protein product [Durusdinium trenchii]|uniref:PUA domain-containing protein n=1 Tax=Durusdinium trenchii TaxID=1381693 RepID=A0ABP0MZX7_9DINO
MDDVKQVIRCQKGHSFSLQFFAAFECNFHEAGYFHTRSSRRMIVLPSAKAGARPGEIGGENNQRWRGSSLELKDLLEWTLSVKTSALRLPQARATQASGERKELQTSFLFCFAYPTARLAGVLTVAYVLRRYNVPACGHDGVRNKMDEGQEAEMLVILIHLQGHWQRALRGSLIRTARNSRGQRKRFGHLKQNNLFFSAHLELPALVRAGRSKPPAGHQRDADTQAVLASTGHGKVGTSSLVESDDRGHRVRLALVSQLVEVIAELRRLEYQVVFISSGAVGMGCIKLGIAKPTDLRKKQAVAAAGQSQLIRMYEDLFGTLGVKVAQLLLSQSDLLDKEHWSNVKVTIMECLALGVVPIINENDSTNTAELRFGDNDNLAALTAVQLEADALCLFTDVSCVYTANPRTNPDAKPLYVVPEPWALKVETKDPGSSLGTGGMSTKILAARTASVSGIPCLLINSSFPRRILSLLEHKPVEDAEARLPEEASYFMAMDTTQTVHDTRRWILSLPVSGQIELDHGAAKALGAKKSLLATGITDVQGVFLRNEALRICHKGNEIARGIINFSSDELSKIMGHSSQHFEEILGFSCCTEACFRSNIILTTSAESLLGIEVPPSQRRLSRDASRSFEH